jgi:hypothetical protein
MVRLAVAHQTGHNHHSVESISGAGLRMSQTSFYGTFDRFILDWTTRVPGSTTEYGGPLRISEPGFQQGFGTHIRAIAEQLLLFDEVKLSVTGPNTGVVAIYNAMGARSFESLLDQGALSFVIWQPTPMFGHDEKTVSATFVGRICDGKNYEIDPERIVDYGLSLCANNMADHYRKRIRRKLIDAHELLDESLANTSWEVANKAIQEGLFESKGLPRDLVVQGSEIAIGNRALKCAQGFLRYRFLLQKGLSSFGDEIVYDSYEAGVSGLRKSESVIKDFSIIAKFESFPDLRSLYDEMQNPFDRISRFRTTETAKKFRRWISGLEAAGGEPIELIRDYVDACSKRHGLFESAIAKFTKAVALVGVGQLLPLALPETAVLGAALASVPLPIVDKALEGGAELCLGLADSFIIENLKVGWTPKSFFRELKKIA